MQLFVDKMEFLKAIVKVERVIDNLKQYHNEQQKAFQELTSSGKGKPEIFSASVHQKYQLKQLWEHT